MIKFVPIVLFIYTLISLLGLAGCSDTAPQQDDEFLLRIGEKMVTRVDFEKAFEIAKSAYPHNIMQKPEALKEAQLRLLNQMTEELILDEHARALKIEISDAELEKAVADIKQDYPEGEFEQTLLENAVSYQTWKNGLRTRLLMEKVVATELEDQISITPEDIAAYYAEHFDKDGGADGEKDASEEKEMDKMAIKHLRRKKAEEAYKSWMNNLQKKYPVEINWEQWEKITGS